MMVERHYEDEALISLLESRREATDAHLPSCPPCLDKLESFRMISGTLRDPDVWDTREIRSDAVRGTIATLRAFANRTVSEDAAAAQILPRLLQGERTEWTLRLRNHPEWRTAGVVRGLIARAYDAVVTMPPDAVAMMSMATEIADQLDPSSYPSDTVAHLRGTAWRDRAYALYYTGAFADALTAVDRADEVLSDCVVDEYDRARVGTVRSLVFRAFERFDEARAVAAQSAKTFENFDDLERLASARLAEVRSLVSRGDYEQAKTILVDVERRLRYTSFADAHARVLGNLGYCYRETGRIAEAISCYEQSTALFESLGVKTEAVRNRWSVGELLAATGRTADAQTRLRSVQAELTRLGMTGEAARAGLDIAEILLAEGRVDEVEQICRTSMESFARSGLAYSGAAQTALAFIREAAQQKRVTSPLVRTVRDYLQRLPEQPQLLFAPPPG